MNRICCLLTFVAALFVTAANLPAQQLPGIPKTLNSGPDYEEIKQQSDKAHHQGNYKKAIELAEQAIRANAKDHVAIYLRGASRIELGRKTGQIDELRNGIADIRKAVALSENQIVMYYLPYLHGMTELSRMEGRKEHAESAIAVAAQIASIDAVSNADKANILYQKANTQLFLQKHDAAFADFKTAIQMSPGHMGARLGLADAYVAAGRTEDAVNAFDDAVENFPNEPLVYNNRGMFLQQIKRSSQAIDDFTMSIKLDSDYFYAYTNRGFARMQLMKAAEAEQDFNESLRIRPNQPMVFSLRGTSRLSQGKIHEAIEDYKRVTQLDPNNSVGHADLGFAHYFLKDYQKADASFAKATELSDNMFFVFPWRYLTQTHMGNEAKARKMYADVINKDIARQRWPERVLAFLADKATEKQLMQSVSKNDLDVNNAQTCEAHYFIAEKKLQQGDTDGARRHFLESVATRATHLSAFRASNLAIKNWNNTANKRSGLFRRN